MLVVIDTNIFISALLAPSSAPARVIELWKRGRFDVLSTVEQTEELNRVTRYPKLRSRLQPALAGRLVNELRSLATLVASPPEVDVSPDPYDNYLLAIASHGLADYLITGDKRDLLSLKKYQGTKIVSVAQFLEMYDQ